MTLPHIISAGIGVQSTALMLMAAAGEIDPMPVCAIFADTQDETRLTYATLAYLQQQQLPFPLLVRTKGRLSAAATLLRLSKKSGNYYTKPSLPLFLRNPEGKISRIGRQCTQDYKIEVVHRAIKEFLGLKHAPSILTAEVWLGISLDEVDRIKDSRAPWLRNCYPLVDMKMTREDCKAWLIEHGHPVPTQSACYYCPFHSDDHWLLLRQTQPDEFERAIAFDHALRASRVGISNLALKGECFLHRSCVPLDQVVFKPKSTGGFAEECEGHCGL